MSFHGFDVSTSNGDYLFAHVAKEAAKTLVEEGRVKWAKVVNCEGRAVIETCGDPEEFPDPPRVSPESAAAAEQLVDQAHKQAQGGSEYGDRARLGPRASTAGPKKQYVTGLAMALIDRLRNFRPMFSRRFIAAGSFFLRLAVVGLLMTTYSYAQRVRGEEPPLDVRREEPRHGHPLNRPEPQPYNRNLRPDVEHQLRCDLLGWDWNPMAKDPECKKPSPPSAELGKARQHQPEKPKQLQQPRQYVPSLGSQMLREEWRESPQQSPASPQDLYKPRT
jgi:hypothetical protein